MYLTNSETHEKLYAYGEYLRCEEKSRATIEKYLRDTRLFLKFAGDGKLEKDVIIRYKEYLAEEYAVTSANSMIAALNSYLNFLGQSELRTKQFKVQRKVFIDEKKELTKAEYLKLVETAEKKNERLALILQTICATGIRVSELRHITAEAVMKGEATVTCKGKTRVIIIVKSLKKKLVKYLKERGIKSGSVFMTRSGKPVDRSNIWREMKLLCDEAGVASEKAFPHNLRHLFARLFYKIEKDIVKLADVLGHSNINTTRIYTITTWKEHKKYLEKLNLIL